MIPACLRERAQWVAWCHERRGGRWTKVPFVASAAKGRTASSTDPATWRSWADAEVAYAWASGLGFVFSDADPYCGIDIDGCLDPASGMLDADVAAIVRSLDSYTEVSPSGSGLHVIVRAVLRGTRRSTGRVALFNEKRFFTMTGDVLGWTAPGVEPRQPEIDRLYAALFPPQPDAGQTRATDMPALSDCDLIGRAMRAGNGAKFKALWAGDWQGYTSQSEADAALVSILAYWTAGDVARIDRLFRQSGLMRRKWDRADYRARTIGFATGGNYG
jgi:primase-polymerase (primpol)-like protein